MHRTTMLFIAAVAVIALAVGIYVVLHRYSDSNITGENGIVLVVIRHNNLTGDDCVLSALDDGWAKAYGTRFNIPFCNPTKFQGLLDEFLDKQRRCTVNGKVDDACMKSPS